MGLDSDEPSSLEACAQAAFRQGQLDVTATLVLEAYGDEIFGFLIDRLRSPSEAGDVFGQFTEDLWRGLPGFQWRSTIRVWAYSVARHAANRHMRQPARRPGRVVPLSQAPEVAAMAEAIRTRTERHLRSEVKSAVRALRDRLSDDDRLLLCLRVDKGLSWSEIACAFEGEAPGDAVALALAAARMRQRFATIKQRLRRMSIEAGLLPAGEPKAHE
jgi:RNA polymerase sigma-70 factor, ECF subfamily